MTEPTATVTYIETDLAIDDLTNADWQRAEAIEIRTYWSGLEAPETRHFRARLLWSDTHFFARFEAEQHEPLIVNPKPNVTTKADELWERDVCEIFLAPDRGHPRRYLEFEAAPTGEWLDLAIEIDGDVRKTEWDFASGLEAAAAVEGTLVTIAIKIPLARFGAPPVRGDIWLGNIFRCVGEGETRGYLAWRPTRTERPAFHVPEAFGKIEFV
ncbi:MAG: hypothetical protein UZ17_ACD001001715 [Acidobacteria bacterium OLB17]|nr:MAG: hypothetical protein UZ17_ACD001001715 [Acidobacteria bacterium OLB17]MCZ2390695.1 carbohydrate-binding family 9-like protein [Acidobacteriota bacterium]